MQSETFNWFTSWIELQSGNAESVCESVAHWLRYNEGEAAWLQSLPKPEGNVVPTFPNEDLWRMYALSRVLDTLISRIEEHSNFLQAYRMFALGLGLREVKRTEFHPFYHEVVSVWQDPAPEAQITLMGQAWPGYMLGPLMFARAGVVVTGGSQLISKQVAENSTMYWTFRRGNRPCEDLSMGWGSNSQWRTSFRRDYVTETCYQYNVDGSGEVTELELADSDRVELVRHRCFILRSHDSADLFPYDEMYVEARC
jgi:hypothetical protein